jgi:Cdc6-like AAA superfamily ATPase
MRVLDFGKCEGTELSNCPEKYILWLAQHEKVLAERNRWASRDAKFLLEKKEEKVVLQAVRAVVCKEFEWQESLQQTILTNRETVFSADEMYTALQSVCKEGEDLDSKDRVIRYLESLVKMPFVAVRLQKVGEKYQFKNVG